MKKRPATRTAQKPNDPKKKENAARLKDAQDSANATQDHRDLAIVRSDASGDEQKRAELTRIENRLWCLRHRERISGIRRGQRRRKWWER